MPRSQLTILLPPDDGGGDEDDFEDLLGQLVIGFWFGFGRDS